MSREDESDELVRALRLINAELVSYLADEAHWSPHFAQAERARLPWPPDSTQWRLLDVAYLAAVRLGLQRFVAMCPEHGDVRGCDPDDKRFQLVLVVAVKAAQGAAAAARKELGGEPLRGLRDLRNRVRAERLRLELSTGRHRSFTAACEAAGVSLAAGKRIRDRDGCRPGSSLA